MKTILYATDYSRNSAAALQLAHLLAKKFDSKLIVLHVFDVPISFASPVSLSYMNKEKKLFVENRAKLRAFCTEHLGDGCEGNNISFMVDEYGSVTEGILEKALKFNVDLIAVGTKGASRVKEFLLGSTTKGLVRKATCPVLAVPEMKKIGNLETLAYATDFEQADIIAIRKLVKIAKAFDARIKVVHITTQKEYAGDQQMEWFKEMLLQKVKYPKMEFDLLFSDDILNRLQTYLLDSDADLLTMLERKDGGFFQAVLQDDLVQKMEGKIDIPLLSYAITNL